MTRPHRLFRALAAAAVMLMLGAGFSGHPLRRVRGVVDPDLGHGLDVVAERPRPVAQERRRKYGMTVNYSGAARRPAASDFLNGTVDFAVTRDPVPACTRGRVRT